MTGKVSIIGGAGRVGSNAAYALQLGRSCKEIVLVDAAADAARGEALDLTHGRAALVGPCIRAGQYQDTAGSNVVVVTAGLRRKPDESRLQLIERNAALFRQIVNDLKNHLSTETILLVVTNPVDILTYLAATVLSWPAQRTIGLGTTLDTLRFRSLLGERLGVEPAPIEGYILGEHGDSMVPIYTSLRYQGAPISSAPGYSENIAREAFAATRAAGAEVIRLKGGAGYAVGLAIRQVIEALLNDDGALLPVSTLHRSGEFADVAFSLPTRIGRAGVLEVSASALKALSESELQGLRQSAAALRTTIKQLKL